MIYTYHRIIQITYIFYSYFIGSTISMYRYIRHLVHCVYDFLSQHALRMEIIIYNNIIGIILYYLIYF